MITVILKVFLSTIAGTLLSALIGCLPAMHVYNVAMLYVIFASTIANTFIGTDPYIIMPFMMGLIIGWAMLNTLPAVFLGAPDESAMLMVLPTQKYLMYGRGYEATMLSGVGALGGIACMLLISPLLPRMLPVLRAVLGPNLFWILALVIAYMVMSEFPKGGDRGPTRLSRFLDAWKSLAAGIATLLLSGYLGFILMWRFQVSETIPFSNIMPAFIGLFGVPWVIQNIISGTEVPPQHTADTIECSPFVLFRGVTSGFLGGGFAAFFPLVTGGIGGLMAGHATAQNDERAFIISMGTSKFVYYVGAFFLLFVPGAYVARGGLANMMRTLFQPRGYGDYYMILGAIALGGALSFVMLSVLAKAMIRLVCVVNYRYISVATLLLMTALVFGITGVRGLFVMLVATGIGLIPVLYHSRRSNCMGVILLPITLNMAGYGPAVARFLGLL